MNTVAAASQKNAFQHFADCADQAPQGTFEAAKSVREVIGNAVDALIRDMRALGLRADNCDGAFALEAAIYEWLKVANPDATLFPTAEGFGAAILGPARERVLAQAQQAAAPCAARDAAAAGDYPFRLDGGEHADHGGQCIIGPDGNRWLAEVITPPGEEAFASRIVRALNALDGDLALACDSDHGALSVLADALLFAIRQVDYLAGGDAGRFNTAEVITKGWSVLGASEAARESGLRNPLRRALRVLEAFERDTPLPEADSAVVADGLAALLEAGYSPDLLCEDTQFDRNALPTMAAA